MEENVREFTVPVGNASRQILVHCAIVSHIQAMEVENVQCARQHNVAYSE